MGHVKLSHAARERQAYGRASDGWKAARSSKHAHCWALKCTKAGKCKHQLLPPKGRHPARTPCRCRCFCRRRMSSAVSRGAPPSPSAASGPSGSSSCSSSARRLRMLRCLPLMAATRSCGRYGAAAAALLMNHQACRGCALCGSCGRQQVARRQTVWRRHGSGGGGSGVQGRLGRAALLHHTVDDLKTCPCLCKGRQAPGSAPLARKLAGHSLADRVSAARGQRMQSGMGCLQGC